MLTNFASDTFREAQERFGFLKRPRGVTVSGDVRLIKPDPADLRSPRSQLWTGARRHAVYR